jgi:hypothetical protein
MPCVLQRKKPEAKHRDARDARSAGAFARAPSGPSRAPEWGAPSVAPPRRGASEGRRRGDAALRYHPRP